jgi:hypothetical protein
MNALPGFARVIKISVKIQKIQRCSGAEQSLRRSATQRRSAQHAVKSEPAPEPPVGQGNADRLSLKTLK